MHRSRCAAFFFAVLLGCSWGGRQINADVVLVTDQTMFDQETSGLTTINFNSFVPSGQTLADYSTSTGLVSGPVTFTGPLSSGTWEGGNDFLYAATPAYFPSYNVYPNSPAVLQGPPGAGDSFLGISGTLNVSVGGAFSAVGSGLYVIQTGVTGAASGDVKIAVTDLSGTYDFTITTSGTFINFVGFLSDSRITSIQYTNQDVGQYPNISNFSYGIQVSSVPEPSSLVLSGSAASVLLAFLALRKVCPQSRFSPRARVSV
jgi:hypothetical protein